MRSKNQELMRKIIVFIETQYQTCGVIPTLREIANEFHITSGCVSNYIAEMKEKGLIESNGKSRSYITNNMTKTNNFSKLVPVVGTIACGTPLLAEENIEMYLPIPKTFLGKGDYFILKANGNSMINAGISNGDYVIVKQQEFAEVGQIVVALIDNDATLKRYYLDDKRHQVRLHPENDEMQDMFFDNIIIQGVAVKVIKDLN